ncbi:MULTISPECIES: AAA family ATPase [Gordonibacter]|uniref:AAA family ATPase n=1 Tax=Gordonibacter faecis TaxID=3047475 RepID=A0ABT7DSH6_9ACTN|nr:MULTISPECIES: AAA family ATPase [unclassified Gordonibacter]MDJ1651481.1 AAA family ATPase [Gordonibacter sp. KGMB12511]HIW76072.1 ATP-binding protein [Candidatus Gordonibacter avicola]
MRLIKFRLNGIDLFENEILAFDFFATDRVPDSSLVYELLKPIYTQKVVGLAGINATGKSTALSFIEAVLKLLSGEPLQSYSQAFYSTAFRKSFQLEALFYQDGQYYLLDSDIHYVAETEEDSSLVPLKLAFADETLWVAKRDVHLKKQLDYKEFRRIATQMIQRSTLSEEAARFLPDDVSVVSSIQKKAKPVVSALYHDAPLQTPVVNRMGGAVANVFDPSIEYLKPSDSGGSLFRLKFKRSAEEEEHFVSVISSMLSSGTIRGIELVDQAVLVLKTGGYLLVDEIENHLNKQLVGMIMSLFDSEETNPYGALLIFTTHYPEALDYMQRKDNLYFLVRNDEHRTQIIKYSDRVKRIENKKSEVFLSNYIKGTAPKYSEVAALKRSVIDRLKDEVHGHQ